MREGEAKERGHMAQIKSGKGRDNGRIARRRAEGGGSNGETANGTNVEDEKAERRNINRGI